VGALMAGERILIVEDNEKNLKLVRDVLQHHGYRTVEARTAEDGLELAAADPPDLVLMDIELPGMGGLEAIGRLKSDQRTATIPVCALTASAMEGDRERCLRAGFDDYMTKPISVSEFPEQIKGWLGGVRGATSA
jgi:two-component system, cell cycle response regulator DivK